MTSFNSTGPSMFHPSAIHDDASPGPDKWTCPVHGPAGEDDVRPVGGVMRCQGCGSKVTPIEGNDMPKPDLTDAIIRDDRMVYLVDANGITVHAIECDDTTEAKTQDNALRAWLREWNVKA